MSEPTLDPVQQELAYYKRQVDELAGQNLKLDYAISGLRHELRQKEQGFALLSHLQQSIGAQKQFSAIVETAIRAINSVLGMDRTVVLSPTERQHFFRPSQWVGFRDQQAEQFPSLEFEFPPEFTSGAGLLVVSRFVTDTGNALLFMAVGMSVYLAQVILLFGVLLLARAVEVFDSRSAGIVLLLSIVTWQVAQMRAWRRARVPVYDEVSSGPDPLGPTGGPTDARADLPTHLTAPVEEPR